MIKPPVPENEKERLEALRALKILDSSPEERYDRLTRLAQRLFDVPIALISLVDENRQWFKSKQGLDGEETDRDVSFCAHAINGNDVMIVNDAIKDTRFNDNPFVTGDPNVRFYAGYPIESPGKLKMGTLCLIDRKPRELNGIELSLLQNLGRLVENELAADTSLSTQLSGDAEQRFFLRVLRYVMEFSRGMNFPMGMIIVQTPIALSMTDFKPINRDIMNVQIAKMIGNSVRLSDVVGALGTDSFYIFLPKCDEAGMEQVKNRLTKNFIAMKPRLQCNPDFKMNQAELLWTPKSKDNVDDLIKKGLKLLEEIRFNS